MLGNILNLYTCLRECTFTSWYFLCVCVGVWVGGSACPFVLLVGCVCVRERVGKVCVCLCKNYMHASVCVCACAFRKLAA